MKFVKERVNVICQELARLSISQKIKITDMQVKNGCYITPAEADASKEPWTSFDTVNDRWYGPDKHYWFRTTITIPESFDGKNLWMRVHAGLDEWDDGRNPQFLLFANAYKYILSDPSLSFNQILFPLGVTIPIVSGSSRISGIWF